MKTNVIYIVGILGTTLLLASPSTLQAQGEQGLNRELTLEREYDPSVRDANKVNTLPAVKEPTVSKSPIDYAFLSLPANPQREIGRLSPGKYKTEIEHDKHRGYLNFGLGNYWNINGDAGYHILNSDKDQLGVYLSHRSTNGNIKYLSGFMKDEAVKAKVNDNLGGIDFRHAFKKAALKLNAQYGYSAFNYYGLPSPPPFSDYRLYSVDTETNQVNRHIVAGIGVESIPGGSAADYHAGLSFTRLSYKYGMDAGSEGTAENTVGGTFGISKPLGGTQRLGIDTKFDYFNYNMPEGGILSFEDFLAGKLNPYYLLEGDFWNFKAGVNIMFFTGSEAKVFASPNLGADMNIGAKTLLYIDIGGGMSANNLFQLSRENRYIAPLYSTLPSQTLLDAVMGLKSGVAPGFWFNIFGGYKYTVDDYFYIPERSWMGFGNMSRTMPLDSKRLYGGLELKYAYQHLFDVTLKGVYNHWTVSSNIKVIDDRHNGINLMPDWKAYGRPKIEAIGSLLVRPVDKLALSLDYHLASGRVSSEGWDEKMKDINELNFTGSYRINDTFGAYLKFNNLLFQRYELIYGYPLQGFSLMGGININF
ncbi:TonB-dependent receptor [Bacteroidia bacterium]|nr:TonB-dependent receptor [Bacteroidia bacterium]